MKIVLPVIRPELLFGVGFLCFLIQGIVSIINFFIFKPNFWGGLGTWAMIIFNLLLAGFFLQMRQNSLKDSDIDKKMEELIKQ
jgi:hypothetical protein